MAADEPLPCPSTERTADVGRLLADRLSEISGLAASRSQPGILWVHNDSGDGAVVYAIDLQGGLVAEIQLIDTDGDNIDAIDWEDIALGPGPRGSDVLYLADIGDNARSREAIRIFCLPEPLIEPRVDGQVVHMAVVCTAIEAIYPDGPRDAETLIVDPITGDVAIVSKDFIHARAYRVRANGDELVTLEFLAQMPWGFMTGGDISPDGSNILLRGYWSAEIWQRAPEGEWWTTLTTPGCPVALAIESQGEAIGFSASGDGYFTISEGIQPSLYFYRHESSQR